MFLEEAMSFAAAFDSLGYAQRLERAGVPRQQAEALRDVAVAVSGSSPLTDSDSGFFVCRFTSPVAVSIRSFLRSAYAARSFLRRNGQSSRNGQRIVHAACRRGRRLSLLGQKRLLL